jgi:hypothetical protein
MMVFIGFAGAGWDRPKAAAAVDNGRENSTFLLDLLKLLLLVPSDSDSDSWSLSLDAWLASCSESVLSSKLLGRRNANPNANPFTTTLNLQRTKVKTWDTFILLNESVNPSALVG